MKHFKSARSAEMAPTLLRTPLLVGGRAVAGKVHERVLPRPLDQYELVTDAGNPSWSVVREVETQEVTYRGPGPVEMSPSSARSTDIGRTGGR